MGGFAEAPAPVFVAHLTSGTQPAERKDEDHGEAARAPTAPAIPRGIQRPLHEDVRARLLIGFPVSERRLSLNNLSTAVLEGGDGPPIVLLHGPAASGAQWRRVIPDLVTTHRVIAPDLPGHGASDAIGRPPDREFMAGWLDDLIECTCPVAPVMVGHTLGGAIAARFASERSDRLAALVLVDTLGLSPFQPSPAFGASLHEFLSHATEGTHNGLWSQCLFDLAMVRSQMAEESARSTPTSWIGSRRQGVCRRSDSSWNGLACPPFLRTSSRALRFPPRSSGDATIARRR